MFRNYLLIGLLCYCSRKHIYVSLLTIGIVSLSIKSKYRNLIRFVFALLVFAIIYNFYADFAEMNEQSIEAQGEGEDFIRFWPWTIIYLSFLTHHFTFGLVQAYHQYLN